MSLRRFLFIPLLISVAFFLWYGSQIMHDSVTVFGHVHLTAGLATAGAAALILQFGGHSLRSWKAQTLLRPIKESTFGNQLRAFSIGQLFNSLLPFRLGEFVRADVLAQRLHISFSYAMVLIMIERAIDVGIIVIVGAGTLTFLDVWPAGSAGVLFWGAIVCIVVLCVIGLLLAQPRWFLRFAHGGTALFNDAIRDHLRFALWSIRYGLQRTLKPRLILVYFAQTLAMWVLYIASAAVLIAAIVPGTGLGRLLNAAAAAYLGIGIPAGPAALGAFTGTANSVNVLSTQLAAEPELQMMILSWVLLVVPISLFGLILLLVRTREPFWAPRPTTASDASLMNKLQRTENISTELSAFLESYFSAGDLSQIVHRLESAREFSLVRYFRGGSDAITILVLEHGQRVVKKIIPLKFQDRLQAQYDWLQTYGGNGIVTAWGAHLGSDYYSIDIDFDTRNIPFFDFLHQAPVAEGRHVLDAVLGMLKQNVYGDTKLGDAAPKLLDAYIDRHIVQCFRKAAAVDPAVARAIEPDTLIVNGQPVKNLRQILTELRETPQAVADIQHYQLAPAVHGDVIVDNILVDPANGKPTLIDPAPDGNMYVGPVFDFGKLMQSLHNGYEFLLRDERPVQLMHGDRIDFQEQVSERYRQLDEYVRGTLAGRYLSPGEQRAMLFHGATLFLRRLKHQVYYTPVNTLKFYAVGVRALNEFVGLYRRP